jgi:DNA polymerase-3 subunit gamma/tau
VRDALSLLDQVLSGADGAVTDAEILNLLGLIDRKVLFDIAAAILAGNLVAILEHLEAVYQRGQDMRKLYADLVEHFRHLVVLQATRQPGRLVDLPEQELNLMRAQIEGHPPAEVGQLLELLFLAESQVRYASQPRLTLEMIFIRLLQARPALGIDTLIERIDALQRGLPPSAVPPLAPPPRAVADAARSAAAIAASAPNRSPEEGEPPQPNRAISADPGMPPSPPPPRPSVSDDPQGAWTTLQKEIEASKPALANTLANCQLTPDEGGGYTLTVTGNNFAVNSVKKNLTKLQKRFSELTGGAAVLKIAQAPDGDQMDRREKRKKAEALKNAALGHPLVGEVIERFQGEVVEVKLL